MKTQTTKQNVQTAAGNNGVVGKEAIVAKVEETTVEKGNKQSGGGQVGNNFLIRYLWYVEAKHISNPVGNIVKQNYGGQRC